MEKIFACEECGQVYHNHPPEVCISSMKTNCKSTKFVQISEKDVLNMHDFPEFILELFIKKILKFFHLC